MMRRTLLAIVVLALPILVVSVLLATQLNATLFDHAPYWNDELFHWHQAATMAEAGFDGGYYSVNEVTALADWSHYYVWGAYTYVPYGLAIQIFGESLVALQFTNLALFLLALTAFMAITRPDEERLIWLALIVGTFIPLLNYMPSSMLQLLHLAVALGIAAGLVRLLTMTVTRRFMLIFGAFLLLVGLLRPTWTIFLLPAIVLYYKNLRPRTLLIAFSIAVPVTLLAAFLFYSAGAPYPHFRTQLFMDAATLPQRIISTLEYMGYSLTLMTGGDPVAIVQRAQIGALLLALIAWGGWQWRRGVAFDEWGWEWLLHGFNLLGFYLLTLAFHETVDSRDYRVMAPHLLLSLVILVAMRRRLFLGLMVALALLGFPALIDNYGYKVPNFNGRVHEEYAFWRPTLEPIVSYEADAANGWCNTLVLSSFYALGQGQAGLVIGIDPGIGLSWAYDWEETGRFRMPETYNARYMMLTADDYERLRETVTLRRLRDVADGNLYLNEDSACPP